MVIENLTITPLGEWLLGAGWYNGWLWQPLGIAFLVVLLGGGGIALVALFRRGMGRPGAELSTWVGGLLGALSLAVLSAVVMCSTNITHFYLDKDFATPLFSRLGPMLGEEAAPANEQPRAKEADQGKADQGKADQGKADQGKDAQSKDSAQAKDKENEPEPPARKNWTSGALYTWLGATLAFFGVIYFFCWLISILSGGPALGTEKCGRAVLEIARDIARISPRRTLALAWLAMRESRRRRVWVVFVVFVLIILMAALFMRKDSLHPSQLYITVVLNCTVFLTMLFALILSSLSLPGDIRERTLHTVVTKPVRKIEIVLGRVLGFTAVGTILLLFIGLISYGFTVRSLRHTHILDSDTLHKQMLPGNRGYLLVGDTNIVYGHSHHVTIKEDEKGDVTEVTVERKQDHTHPVYITHKDGKTTYELGEPEGQLQARVPIYGKLHFLDETGKPKERGINVGDEWQYRSFIKGRTSAMATWTFSNLRPDMFPESQFPHGIPVDLTIEVFRTHKGNMEKGVPGSIWLSNPQTGKKVRLEDFAAEKFATDEHMIPLQFAREGRDGKIEHYDLFRDLVSDKGELAVSLQCLEYGQSFGMAEADMYIRAADASFEVNFAKAYLGIWLQMVLVLSLGVMFSTLVSGPVALLATIFAVIVGLFSSYIVDIGSGHMIGGGPFESMQRVMTQDNMISPLEPGLKTSTIKALDAANALVMRDFSAILPEINDCFFAGHLAFGFDVGRDLLWRCILRELGFVLPVILLGFIWLRLREVAQ